MIRRQLRAASEHARLWTLGKTAPLRLGGVAVTGHGCLPTA